MAKRITKKETINSVVIETSGEAIANAEAIAVDAASNVSVFTGSTAAAGETKTVAKTTVKGGASNAAVRDVAVGATFAPGEGSLDSSGVNQFSTDYIVDASGNKISDIQWTTDKKGKIVAPKLLKGQRFVSEIIINSDNEIVLDSVAVKGAVYGGAIARDIKGKVNKKNDGSVSAIVNGDSSITLKNVTASKVFGGGAGYGSVLNGNVSIDYYGGKIGTIYGGGDEGSVVNGDVEISVQGMSSGRISKIYAGGKNSIVTGNVTVTFGANPGNYENFVYTVSKDNVFSGTVYGGGEGKNARVEGTSDLVFNNYSGEFKGSIKDFDSVTISGQSNVTFTKGQDKTMKGAEYIFVINDATLGLQSPMLTWNQKVNLSKITVVVETKNAFSGIVLISSTKFSKPADFNIDSIKVTNEDGETLWKEAYSLNYIAMYEQNEKGKWIKVNDAGKVTIDYIGTKLSFDKEINEKVVLSGADDEVNLAEGADLKFGLDTGGGDDKVNLGEGAKITGDIALGEGNNSLTVQKDAQHSGTIILEEGSNNTVKVNGGAISGAIKAGDGSNNTITLNGTIQGGGVGYWLNLKPTITATGVYEITLPNGDKVVLPGDYVNNSNPNRVFVTGNLDLRDSNSNDKVYINQYAAVNSVYLGGGNDYLEIAADSFLGVAFVSLGNVAGNIDAGASTIDLGTGNNTLVLKGTLRDNVSVVADKGSKNTIVLAANGITIDNTKLLAGSTDNIFVLANGIRATVENAAVGSFISGGKFSGIYLGQNAVAQFSEADLIQNYAGYFHSDRSIRIIGSFGEAPENISDFYSKDTDGVEASMIDGQAIILESGAKVASSTLAATKEVNVKEGASVTDTKISGNANTNVTLSGTVSGGSVETAKKVLVDSVDALVGAIDDVATLEFKLDGGVYTNDTLALSKIGKVKIDQDSSVTAGSFDGSFVYGEDKYTAMDFGKNARFIAGQNITINDADVAQTFAAGYSVDIFGTISADVTFNGNKVTILSGRSTKDTSTAISITGDIYGAADFVIAKGVSTWFDIAQFKNLAETSFTVQKDAFLAFDGVISGEDQEKLIESVNIEKNGKFGLGAWLVIKDWDGDFNMATDGSVSGFANDGHVAVLKFTDLYIKNNATINGHIVMQNDETANNIVIGENVTVNGARDQYDFGAILTYGGDDTLEIRSGSVINGTIDMGKGNDTLTMTGVTVNHAVNQQQGEKIAQPVINGVDNLYLNGGNQINGAVYFDKENENKIYNSGDNTVSGRLVFAAGSTNEININSGKLTVDEIAFADFDNNGQQFKDDASTAAASNKINVKGELALTQGLELKASGDNEINIEGGVITGVTEIALNGGKELNDDKSISKINASANNSLKFADSTASLTSVDMTGSGKNAVEVSETGTLTIDHLDMSGAVTMPTDQDLTGAKVEAAAANEIKNKGTLNLGDVHAVGATNTLENSGTLSADDIVFAGEVRFDDELVIHDAADKNEIKKNTGSISAASLTMRGKENEINSIGSVEVTGNLDMVGRVDVDPKAENAEEKVKTGLATSNTIALFDQEDKASLKEHSASLKADRINMKGAANTINGNVVLDTTNSDLVDKDNSITAGAINTTIAGAVNMESETGANKLDMGVTGNVAGVALKGSKVTFGKTAQTVNGDVSMKSVKEDEKDGGTNTLDLNIVLKAEGDSDIVTDDISAALNGDVAMTGKTNTLNGKIKLEVSSHGAITAGNLSVSITGNIVMDTLAISGGANTINFGSHITDTSEKDPAARPGEISYGSVSITVTGDITMKGIGAENTLKFGKDVTYTGNVVMGNTDMKVFSETNNLKIEDVSKVDIQNLNLIARTNNIDLAGEGKVSYLNNIRGGVNNFTIRKGVEIVGDIVFNDIINEDKKGQDGYIVLANTENTLRIEGATANNISAIASGANTTIWVGFENTPKFEDAADSVVNGDLNMGTAESTGSNTLNVYSTVVTEKLEDGTEVKHGFVGTVNGNVAMTSSANEDGTKAGSNSIALKGAVIDADEKIEGSVRQVFLAVIDGNVDMVSERDNTITAEIATITGNVAMTGAKNTITATKAVQFGTADAAADITMEAISVEGYNDGKTNNSLTLEGFAAGAAEKDATAKEPSVEGKEAEQAKAGNIVMNSANGSNTANFADAEVGTISMDSSVADSKNVTKAEAAVNTLTLKGSVKTDSIWSEDYQQAVQVETVYAAKAGAVTMTAANGNSFTAKYADIDGAVVMTANGVNVDDGKELSNTADFHVVNADSIEMNAIVPEGAELTANNTLAISGERVVNLNGDAPDTVKRSTVGDVTMTAANNNTLTLGTDAAAAIGAVTLAKLVMNGGKEGANTVNVSAGALKKYENGPAAGTEVNFRAEASSIDMNARDNSLNVNAGTFGIKDGNVTMTNLDADGVVIAAGSDNVIKISESGSLLLDNGGLLLGSAGLSVETKNGGTYINGNEVTLLYVNEYGEYVYAWTDGGTDGGDSIATASNTVEIKGKLHTTVDSRLVGVTNKISVEGAAVKDPTVGEDVNGDDPTVSSAVFTNLVMQGNVSNTIETKGTDYKSSFSAQSITMEGISDGDKVSLANAANTITVGANTFFNVAVGISMTATDSNTITANDFTNVISAKDLESATVEGMFLGTADTSIAKENEHYANTLGNVVMTATGIINEDGEVAIYGANTLMIGANTVAGTVAMIGVQNTLTLNDKTEVTYDVIRAGDYKAVDKDGLTQEEYQEIHGSVSGWVAAQETVITQAAGKADDVTFTIGSDALKEALAKGGATAAAQLVNTVALGKGSSVASITSTDTYTYVDGDETITVGAADSVTLKDDASVLGKIDLGYGNDTITVSGVNVSLKDIDFGDGDDDVLDLGGHSITVDGDITYSGKLTVKNGTISFTEGHGFVGDKDNLFFDGMTVYGNIDTNVQALSALTVGNGTLNASVTYVKAEAGELNIDVEKDADDKVIGDTYIVTEDGSVNFNDSRTRYVEKGVTPVDVDPLNDALNVKEGAKLTLDGVVNFGIGANTIALEVGASLTLNKAWTSEVSFVRAGSGEAINAAGQTLEEWVAAKNDPKDFVAKVQTGTVAVSMEGKSAFTVNAEAAASVTLKGYNGYDDDGKPVYGSYTIAGTGKLIGDIAVDSSVVTDAQYTLNLGTALKGNITLGANADTLNLTATVDGAIDMGAGEDTVNVYAGSKFTSLANAESLNVHDVFTVNAPKVDETEAYNMVDANTVIYVYEGGTLTVAGTTFKSLTVFGGTLKTADTITVDATVTSGTIGGATVGTLTATGSFSLTGTNAISTLEVANGTSEKPNAVTVTGDINQKQDLTITVGTDASLKLGNVTLTDKSLTATGVAIDADAVSVAKITAAEVNTTGKLTLTGEGSTFAVKNIASVELTASNSANAIITDSALDADASQWAEIVSGGNVSLDLKNLSTAGNSSVIYSGEDSTLADWANGANEIKLGSLTFTNDGGGWIAESAIADTQWELSSANKKVTLTLAAV